MPLVKCSKCVCRHNSTHHFNKKKDNLWLSTPSCYPPFPSQWLLIGRQYLSEIQTIHITKHFLRALLQTKHCKTCKRDGERHYLQPIRCSLEKSTQITIAQSKAILDVIRNINHLPGRVPRKGCEHTCILPELA